MQPSDLVKVRPFPSVVQAADVAALRAREDNDPTLRDFVGGYLGFDERSRHALNTLLRSLTRADQGGGFFLNGVFGSGKSHLLGLIALLCDGRGHNFFAATHPPMASQLSDLPPRFAVHFSLDNYDAARFSLEEVFWRELRAEWRRQNLPPGILNDILSEAAPGARAEQFVALDEALARYGRQGLVICGDELSLFLSAKDHKALQADAGFLQFLGQRAMRGPLWCVFTLQKTMEDVGELEEYSLSQIRDRFTLLPLSLAHIPALIQHRLVQRKDAAALQRISYESYEKLNVALPRLDFGRREWEELYPFYPATISLLEQVVARFFSRTRSAALFCSQSASALVANSEDATDRILPPALWDYIEPELGEHPDLRPLAAVWRDWRESLPELSQDENDARFLEMLMKGLLLFKIAGVAPSVSQLANALAFDAQLPGEGNYQYAAVLLERLRGQGSHLAVERHDEPFADRYALDAGTRVGEAARRYTRNALSTLPERDARLAAFAVSCCRDEPLPLAAIGSTASSAILWRNGARRIAVEIWQKLVSPQTLANRMAMIATPGGEEDALLLIVPPFAKADEVSLESVAALLPDDRWRAALILWRPRAATQSERENAREALAAHLLEDDPQLLDNRRGRAVLEHLKTQSAARETMLARTAARLLQEGALSNASGQIIEAAELAGGENWNSALEAIAEWTLPFVFPRFEGIAPRLRVLTPSNADALCLETLRRPADEPFFGPSLERAARAIAEPLGIAESSAGRWRIAGLRVDLKDELLELIGDGAAFSAIESQLSKSEWGLRAEQTNLAVCALLRSGDVVALDGRGSVLSAASIGMPLRRAVHSLRPGQLLEDSLWPRAAALVALLTGEELREHSFASQEKARALLISWRDETRAEAELFQARLRQLQRELGHAPAQWPRVEAMLEKLASLIENFDVEAPAVLPRAAVLDVETFDSLIEDWNTTSSLLENRHAALLAAHALLSHSDLAAPPDLQSSRAALLERLQNGEAVLEDVALPADAGNWRAEYSALYRDWHETQGVAARWNALRRIAHSDELRALIRLGALKNRAFPQGEILRAEIGVELNKACPRDGSLRADEAVCPHCRLRLNERLRLRDASEFETLLQADLAAFHAALQEPAARDYLNRHETAQSLLNWPGNETEILPILSDEVLSLLDEAFRPRRRVERHLEELIARFKTCRTRAEVEASFADWLDGGSNLATDDEVVVVLD